MTREKKIIETSVLGIIMNVLLVIFKTLVGILANSIAIILDAVNNLSDVVSSIVSIIGAKLSSKAPDREHPFGHGRIEYFSAVIISMLVLWAGVECLKESIAKIIEPLETHYSIATIIVVTVSIIVKFLYGRYTKKVGKRLEAQSLVASGTDAYMDAVLSVTTLIGIIVSLKFNIIIDGYLGVIISVMIIKSCVSILKETADRMIGQRVDPQLSKKIKEKINSFKEVNGTYDLMLHSYGPETYVGSCNIEIDEKLTANQIHSLTKRISEDVFKEFNIYMTIGIYASNNCDLAEKMKAILQKVVEEDNKVLQLHGFFLDEEKKQVSFDLIFDFKIDDREKLKEDIINKLKEEYPDYEFNMVIDPDISD